MNPSRHLLLACTAAVLAVPAAPAADAPAGYWTTEQARSILDKTLRVHLAPSLESLTAAEHAAVRKLLEAGEIMQRLYERSRHPQASEARADLLHRAGEQDADREWVSLLLDLYRLYQGPIATTLENERVPFLPVVVESLGKNVYPPGITRDEIDRFLAARPEARPSLLHPRHVVRRALAENTRDDLAVLERHPALALLHPGLRQRLESLHAKPSPAVLYALPYSVAYADELVDVFRLLHEAAAALDETDAAFARFLRNRARDLLTDDYEAGDASWVTGRFRNLNAQIGSYETYGDQLYGVKTFFGLSLLIRDPVRSAELAAAIAGLQEIEDSLPYASSRKIREDIPIGVYQIIADFGDARGGNTATILPNESYLSRQYGRTILLRGNILTDPQIFAIARSNFESAVHPGHHDDLTRDADLYRTLWHEIGHYLGVDQTRDGRDLDSALEDTSDLLEEMKSDLVALYSVRYLSGRGYYDEAKARAVYAAGIRRVLQKSRPRRDQPYQTMQLMQWNGFLENGVLRFDEASQTLRIDYQRYHPVVETMLAEVLSIQAEGSRARAEAFVQRYTAWDDALHAVVAGNMRAQETYRYTLVTYAAE